jgi:hypothetical protein
MLAGVLLVMGPEVAVGPVRGGCVKSEGVELVVAHDRQSCPGVDHGPDDLKGLLDLGAPVDEVPEKDGLAFWMPVDPFAAGIAKLAKELLQGVSMAVDVADEVVHM